MDKQKILREEITFAEAMAHLRGDTGRRVWDYESWTGLEPFGKEQKFCLVVGGYVELIELGAPVAEGFESTTAIYAYKRTWVKRYYFHFAHDGQAEVLHG